MTSRRWWDAAIAAVVVAMTVFAWFSGELSRAQTAILPAVGLALFLTSYLAFARPALGVDPPGWRTVAFVGLVTVSIGIGVAAIPMMANLQTVAYPLAWVLTATRWQAIGASAAIAFSVLIGFVAGMHGPVSGWTWGLVTAIFSFIFAIAIGLWISRIIEYGEERARLVDELTSAQAQIESLSRDRGAAAERERLARDIHDTLAQSLAGLVILAERAGRQSRLGQPDEAAASVATLEGVAREALAEARALVARTAAVPSEPAFGGAAERLVERFRAEAGLSIDLDLPPDPAPALSDRETQVVLLRCLQEALANVGRHAGATRVGVRVRAGDDGIALTVTDDGRGFDADALRSGFGLDGMAERVALAGGQLELVSSRGAGTEVRVLLPGATRGDA